MFTKFISRINFTFLLPDVVVKIWNFCRLPFAIAFGIFLFWQLAFRVCCLWLRIVKRVKKPKGKHIYVKRAKLIKQLLMLPYRYAHDYMRCDPSYFAEDGIIIFTGMQGSGKTVALVEQSLNWQAEYPRCKCISNLGYKYADNELSHWTQLLNYNNGIYGVLVQMDETQNWFSSNQSKDFPVEMLETVTQNRKNRRVILGTAQSFNRLSKPLREQTKEVRKCATLFGCWTFVHVVKPEIDNKGDVTAWKHRRFYSFVHTDKIRNAYDTYHVIESLSKSGFQPRVLVDGADVLGSSGRTPSVGAQSKRGFIRNKK